MNARVSRHTIMSNYCDKHGADLFLHDLHAINPHKINSARFSLIFVINLFLISTKASTMFRVIGAGT